MADPEPDTMRAVVFHGPRRISVERRPIPQVQEPGDIIVKVDRTGLCGSDLHVYRGTEPLPPTTRPFTMGHELTGTIHALHSSFSTTSTSTLHLGDRIICPFTTSCNSCFYCTNSSSSRCNSSLLLGSPALEGAQAEYVRIPRAEGTVVKAPEGVGEELLVLMADIWPTGWYAARRGMDGWGERRAGKGEEGEVGQKRGEQVVVLVGCGPVALCALLNLLDYGPKKVIAVDAVTSRLELAASLGAEPWNFQTNLPGLEARVAELTDGRGADVVVEVVGSSAALRLGFDLVRPFGVLSSVGVHNGEIPWSGAEAYNKNLTVVMGRCPVRSVFEEALEGLKRHQDKLGFMADHVMGLSEAAEAYELFDKMKVQKIVFDPRR